MPKKTTKKVVVKVRKIKNELYKPVILEEKEFYSSISKAMETSKHKQELQYIIDEFEEYKKFAEEITVPCDLESHNILTFRSTYQGKKNVWKEIEVFGS